MSLVAKVKYTTFAESVPKALDLVGAARAVAGRSPVALVPNLTKEHPPPVTTDLGFAEAILEYFLNHGAEVVIAGGPGCNADPVKCWQGLGFADMAARHGVEIVDLNESPVVTVRDDAFLKWDEIRYPRILQDAFVVSMPPLKAHNHDKRPDHRATVTLSLKNMFSAYPGAEGKRAAHQWPIRYSIVDIVRCHVPDLAVIDGSIGQAEGPGRGKLCDPPRETIIASLDPVAADAVGADVLGGFHWPEIDHIRMCHEAGFGSADRIEIVEG